MTVVKQKIGRIAVVGVVKGVRRGSVGVRFFVLGEENVQIPVRIDIAAGHDHGVLDRRFANKLCGLIELALGRAFKKIKTVVLVTEQIDEAIAVKVSEERSPNIGRGKPAKFFWTIRAVALPPIKKIFCDQKNFGKSVLVEIVNDERINQVRVFRGRDFFVKNQSKRLIAFASLDRQVKGVDSFCWDQPFHVF